MTAAILLAPLPRFSLDHLMAIEPGLPVLARLGVTGHGSAPRGTLERALASLYASSGGFAQALAGLAAQGCVAISRNGHCRITGTGRKYAEARLGSLLGRSWADAAAALAALSLGIDVAAAPTRAYLARRGNLECAALARLYGLDGLSPMPSRGDVRGALLRSFVAARLPECEAAVMENPMRNTSRDPVGRAVMLGAAGLNRGTHRDAETALLRKALGLRADAGGSIADALIRNALAKGAQRGAVQAAKEARRDGRDRAGLAAFAASVRDLARTLRTDPFAGRVAIAQVYDAGLARGADFGTLDAFKARIAEAGRAGLLDLERYDIAGPMDAALRDRSRTAFGRDERHFIVNEWI
jgi:hypothetical protein